MKLELNCSVCGGNRFDFPSALKDDSVISCVDCGHHVGTLTELQDRLISELTSRLAKGSAARSD